MRVQSAAFRYVDERRQAGRFRGDTPRNTGYTLSQFADFVGPDLDTSQLTVRHIRGWVGSMTGTVADSTVHKKFTTLRSFFVWLYRNKLISTQPFRDLDAPKKPEALPRALTADQMTALFAVVPDLRGELICSLMVQSGLRAGEVATAEVGKIDFARRVMLVVGKGGRERRVPLFDETWEILDRYLNAHPARSGRLIRSYRHPNRGISAQAVSKLLSEWCWNAGIKSRPFDGISAHALRHTCATDVVEQSGNVKAAQELLGHANLATTNIYVKMSVENVRRAAAGRTYR